MASLIQRKIARRVVQDAATALGVTRERLVGPQRPRSLVRIRFAAMWLARSASGCSYPEIGSICGRDHTTVINAVRRWSALLEARDPMALRMTSRIVDHALGRLAGSKEQVQWISP